MTFQDHDTIPVSATLGLRWLPSVISCFQVKVCLFKMEKITFDVECKFLQIHSYWEHLSKRSARKIFQRTWPWPTPRFTPPILVVFVLLWIIERERDWVNLYNLKSCSFLTSENKQNYSKGSSISSWRLYQSRERNFFFHFTVKNY